MSRSAISQIGWVLVSLSGDAMVVDFNLASRIGPDARGGRVTDYVFGDTGDTFSVAGMIISFSDFDVGSERNYLTLDLTGSTIGDHLLDLTGSEQAWKCFTVFYGGCPGNSCTLPGLYGSGLYGGNGETAMSVAVEGSGGGSGGATTGGGSGSSVPLPAPLLLLLAGLGFLVQRGWRWSEGRGICRE